jgi:hypothetical protein
MAPIGSIPKVTGNRMARPADGPKPGNHAHDHADHRADEKVGDVDRRDGDRQPHEKVSEYVHLGYSDEGLAFLRRWVVIAAN